MGVIAEGQVGPRQQGDGSVSEIRLARAGSVVVNSGHGNFYEACARGRVFSASTAPGGTTIVAGNVSPVGAAAASVLSLYNPQNSTVYAVLHKTIVGNVSGTPGAGNAWAYDFAYNQNITATMNNSGVASAAPAANLISGGQGSVQAFTQTAITGSTLATMFRVLGHTAFATALAATTPNMVYTELNDGDIIIPPGGLLHISPIAIGTTHIVYAGFTWEEVPI